MSKAKTKLDKELEHLEIEFIGKMNGIAQLGKVRLIDLNHSFFEYNEKLQELLASKLKERETELNKIIDDGVRLGIGMLFEQMMENPDQLEQLWHAAKLKSKKK